MTFLEYLNQIQERCDAATEGPWWLSEDKDDDVTSVSHQAGKNSYDSSICCNTAYYPTTVRVRDMNFIAHARQDVEVLLEMVTKLKEGMEVIQYQNSSFNSEQIATSVLIEIDDLVTRGYEND